MVFVEIAGSRLASAQQLRTKKSAMEGAKSGIQCGTCDQSRMGANVHSDSTGDTAKPPNAVGLRNWW